jgi:hypothetical protein
VQVDKEGKNCIEAEGGRTRSTWAVHHGHYVPFLTVQASGDKTGDGGAFAGAGGGQEDTADSPAKLTIDKGTKGTKRSTAPGQTSLAKV